MPPPNKTPYKTYPILLKTHRVTLFLEAPPSKTIASLKEDTLSALASKVGGTLEEDIPEVQSVDDFELCREIREKGKAPTGKYEILDGKENVKNVAQAWEVLFIRFKDTNGKLAPVEVVLPSVLGDDDDPAPVPGSNKGKRKAIPE